MWTTPHDDKTWLGLFLFFRFVVCNSQNVNEFFTRFRISLSISHCFQTTDSRDSMCSILAGNLNNFYLWMKLDPFSHNSLAYISPLSSSFLYSQLKSFNSRKITIKVALSGVIKSVREGRVQWALNNCTHCLFHGWFAIFQKTFSLVDIKSLVTHNVFHDWLILSKNNWNIFLPFLEHGSTKKSSSQIKACSPYFPQLFLINTIMCINSYPVSTQNTFHSTNAWANWV